MTPEPAPLRRAGRGSRGGDGLFGEPLAAKVPEIGVMFWVIKVLSTGMGEAASDFLANISVVLAGALGVIGFAVAMVVQFHLRRYVAAGYWFAVAMVAVFGTMAADGLHVALGIPYVASTAFYLVVVSVIFWLWRRSEGTLSIHSITTTRRELFYWATVLATFALGTAAGDLTAASMHLGYFWSAMLFTAAITVPALGWWRFGLNPVLAFWVAYVITRPIGASFADWLGKPRAMNHGLGYGDGAVTVTATVLIVVLVACVARSGRDVQPPDAQRQPAGRRERTPDSPVAEY